MSDNDRERLREVEDNLSSVLDGTAPANIYDFVAQDDEARDLKYDAERAAELIGFAADDFAEPEGFAERLTEGVLSKRPTSGTRAAGSTDVEASGVLGTTASSPDPIDGAHPTVDVTHASASEEPRAVTSSGVQKTVPLQAALAAADETVASEGASTESRAESQVASSGMSHTQQLDFSLSPTAHVPSDIEPGIDQAPEEEAESLGASRSPSSEAEAARSAEVAEASFGKQDNRSGDALTPHGVRTPHEGALSDRATQPSVDVGGAPPGPTVVDQGTAPGPDAPPAARTEPRDNVGKGARVIPIVRRKWFLPSLVASMAAAAAAGFAFFGDRFITEEEPTATVVPSWAGEVVAVSRASADKDGGLVLCTTDGDDCAPVEGGESFDGGVLRTDSRTRAQLKLTDGTVLSLDRGSELMLEPGETRVATLKEGSLVADVATVEGADPARFVLPQAEVEVIATKLGITALPTRAAVEVARGEVRLVPERGDSVSVRAGEEATIIGSSAPVVAPSTSLADMMEWSDQSAEEVDSPILRGLGELRARKPGSEEEMTQAVRLSKHAAKVRIVDVVARTEIDETFTNDTDEELEGIFRFPLPPGAKIERLALEVDGELMEGAFVDRTRGAAIWRGVIQNAAPRAPKPKDEIIWVPGPWRDPALLEWQRGGRFELRIFPIPPNSSRRVVLTYTQTVDQSANVRRFTYPLAHDASGSTKIDDFSMDVQVLGHDEEVGVATVGYDVTQGDAPSGAERFSFSAQDFVPAGDLRVEYALPDRDKELTAWAFDAGDLSTGDAGADPSSGARNTAGGSATGGGLGGADGLVDDRPFVTIALRPKLPRWEEGQSRTHMLVVDSSRSMVGERFARATRLASTIVREMDRRDNFMLLACDTTCRAMGDGGQPAPFPVNHAPSASSAEDVERFLGRIEPDGGSDLSAMMQAARTAAGGSAGRALRILYVGDGTPSVGPTQPSTLEAAVRHALPAGQGRVVAAAIGSDADADMLDALARGGGGVVVPYVPGQKVASAALGVLSAAYGVVLEDPIVDLPPGLEEVSPSSITPIPAGGERFITARMNGDRVDGKVTLRGRVAGESFEQSYPIDVVATSNAGNAFVPRMFAAERIAELERLGRPADKETIIDLSQRFAVASRHTSLLVLESEAMFDAFGLERNRVAPQFTGELRAESTSADIEDEEKFIASEISNSLAAGPAKKAKPNLDPRDPWGADDGDGSFGFGAGSAGEAGGNIGGSKDKEESKIATATPSPDFAPPSEPMPAPTMPMAPPPQPPPPPPPAFKPGGGKVAGSTGADSAADNPFSPDQWNQGQVAQQVPPPAWRPPPQQQMIPMRRVFDRKVQFSQGNALVADRAEDLQEAERLLGEAPDSRDRTSDLLALYALTGRLGEASELTAKWAGRDALDPGALLARADLAARQGDRDRAVRILGGLTDVRPNDDAIQTRLAGIFERQGSTALACEHRITLAELDPRKLDRVAAAVRCSRDQGLSGLASALENLVEDGERSRLSTLVSQIAPDQGQNVLGGDVRIKASWSGGQDLDVALIDENGQRLSWLGSESQVRVSAKDPRSTSEEQLALLGMPSGRYVIEVTRASTDGSSAPVSGEVVLTLPGEGTRTVPFTLEGPRAEIGTMRVFFTSRLVPVGAGSNPMGW